MNINVLKFSSESGLCFGSSHRYTINYVSNKNITQVFIILVLMHKKNLCPSPKTKNLCLKSLPVKFKWFKQTKYKENGRKADLSVYLTDRLADSQSY